MERRPAVLMERTSSGDEAGSDQAQQMRTKTLASAT